jgi:hypothetical protein
MTQHPFDLVNQTGLESQVYQYLGENTMAKLRRQFNAVWNDKALTWRDPAHNFQVYLCFDGWESDGYLTLRYKLPDGSFSTNDVFVQPAQGPALFSALTLATDQLFRYYQKALEIPRDFPMTHEQLTELELQLQIQYAKPDQNPAMAIAMAKAHIIELLKPGNAPGDFSVNKSQIKL